MPVNFGNYVYRPATPLGVGGMGEGLDSIIQNNQEKARRAQQESQYARTRSDNQNLNAANFGRDEANTAFTSTKGRYDQQRQAVEKARAAAQGGQYDVADSLVPTILALGGEARKNPDGTYYFKEGAAPTRGGVDVGAARRQLYQGAPPGTGANQPFQVPGFGAGGQRNPFEPQAVSGASAAALPPPPGAAASPPAAAGGAPPPAPNAGPPPGAAAPDSAGPPPGAARSVPPAGALWLPPGMDPGPQPAAPVAPEAPVAPTSAEADLAALEAVEAEPVETEAPPATSSQGQAGGQTQQPGSPQLTGANPFQPPGLDPYSDPYTIDPKQVRQRNSERLQPFLGGVAKAAGSRYQGRIEEINKYVNSLGLPPAEALKVTEKLYGEIFGLARSELAMEGQAGRAATTARHQESVQYDKDRDRGLRIANARMALYDTKGTRKKLEAARGVEDLLKSAHRNGSTANALIRLVYKMHAEGVMTDNDYTDTREGVSNLFQRIKNRTLHELNPHGGGLPLDTIDDMKELVEVALRGHRRVAAETADSLYRAYKANRNEAEREALRESFSAFDEEFLPQEFKMQDSGDGIPQVAPEDEQAEMRRMAAAEGGVVDVTDGVPAGRHPAAPLRTRNKPVAKKPGDVAPSYKGKAVDEMTDEEMKAAVEELRKKAEGN